MLVSQVVSNLHFILFKHGICTTSCSIREIHGKVRKLRLCAISKTSTSSIRKLVTVARSRAYRENQGKILLEGRRLISDALVAGARPQTLFFSSVDRLSELPLDKLKRANLVKVKFEDLKKWSDLIAPQGVIGEVPPPCTYLNVKLQWNGLKALIVILKVIFICLKCIVAIFSRPEVDQLAFPKDRQGQSVPLSLICDNIRDPGNLGTILRCAAAAGCHNVLLSKGT